MHIQGQAMRYHMIGIGGIGMCALARTLKGRGIPVQGSDHKPSALIDALVSEGIRVEIGHRSDLIQEGMTVVYSTDIQESNVELQEAKRLQLPLLHRSDLLHQMMRSRQPLLVTGTHGKTTATALLAWTLITAEMDPSFVVGGIVKGLNTNGASGTGSYFVAEADESDGSCLKTPYYGAIVTNVEQEHLNYWKSEERLLEGFRQFFKLGTMFNHLFWCRDDVALAKLYPPGRSYGFDPRSDCRIERLVHRPSGIEYDLHMEGTSLFNLQVALHGKHNALNSAAVCALALSLGIAEEAIRKAFITFGGTKRRLEKIGSARGIDIYDDYAHHPTEIRATLEACSMLAEQRRLVALFQPHRYTRVKDLFQQFLGSFDRADLVVLTDVYAAGEAPLEGASTEHLLKMLRNRLGAKIQYAPRQQLEEQTALMLQEGDVVLTLGAGDITAAARGLFAILEKS